MARHDETYKGIRFIVDTVAASSGRFGYQAVVDGKRPLLGAPSGSSDVAMAEGIAAAREKIDSIIAAYRKPGT